MEWVNGANWVEGMSSVCHAYNETDHCTYDETLFWLNQNVYGTFLCPPSTSVASVDRFIWVACCDQAALSEFGL